MSVWIWFRKRNWSFIYNFSSVAQFTVTIYCMIWYISTVSFKKLGVWVKIVSWRNLKLMVLFRRDKIRGPFISAYSLVVPSLLDFSGKHMVTWSRFLELDHPKLSIFLCPKSVFVSERLGLWFDAHFCGYMVPIYKFVLFMCIIDIFFIMPIIITDPCKPKYNPKLHEIHHFKGAMVLELNLRNIFWCLY